MPWKAKEGEKTMTDAALFLGGLGTTLRVCLVVVTFLQRSLRKLLADICGTETGAARDSSEDVWRDGWSN